MLVKNKQREFRSHQAENLVFFVFDQKMKSEKKKSGGGRSVIAVPLL